MKCFGYSDGRLYLDYSGAEMTPDLIRALSISGSILAAVVILIVLVSIITVRRGEASMAAETKHQGRSRH